jgi:hypothetical protein
MKFIDYNSPEKAIINTTFKTIPYMDMWISSIVEGEYKEWLSKGILSIHCYYKNGKPLPFFSL